MKYYDIEGLINKINIFVNSILIEEKEVENERLETLEELENNFIDFK